MVTSIAIEHYSFICTQSNVSKYRYVSQRIQLDISSFFTQLSNQTVLFLTIQFNKSHLFAYSLNSQTVLFDP